MIGRLYACRFNIDVPDFSIVYRAQQDLVSLLEKHNIFNSLINLENQHNKIVLHISTGSIERDFDFTLSIDRAIHHCRVDIISTNYLIMLDLKENLNKLFKLGGGEFSEHTQYKLIMEVYDIAIIQSKNDYETNEIGELPEEANNTVHKELIYENAVICSTSNPIPWEFVSKYAPTEEKRKLRD